LLTVFALHTVEDAWGASNRVASTVMNERWMSLAEAARAAPGSSIVIASPRVYLEVFTYAPPELQARLFNVIDPDASIRLLGQDTADRNSRILAQFVPLRIESPEQFQASHQRFILRSGGPDDWYTRYLIEERFDLRLLPGNMQIHDYYLVSRKFE
jgi:hypothetical protein